MDWLSMMLIIAGLAVFEIVISIDNAIINAEVLSTMTKKGRTWFLFWGILIAVFFVRGLLPWLILWISTPSLGFIGSFSASFRSDPAAVQAIKASAPVLLVGGGTFLVFLFFHWLFLEPKCYGLMGEEFFQKQGIWFFAVVSLVLVVIVWMAIQANPPMALGAVVGSSAFFISSGFKENASQAEKRMMAGAEALSDISKIFYLEVIDMSFSIDGVLGAFAFTFNIPLILIGNGIGAIVVRQLTVANIDRVKRYRYLKNGAMYSIFALGGVMIGHGFGLHIPEWFSPVITFVIIGFFFWRSVRLLRMDAVQKKT